MGKVKIGNFKGPKGDTGAQGPTGPQGPEGPQGPMGEVDANTQIVFTQATSRENIASGEKLNIILGKIRKWFADIRGAAFQDVSNTLTTTEAGKVLDARQGKVLDKKVTEKLDKTDVVNGLTETAAGKALDARQGKVLDEKIDDLSKKVSDLNSKLAGGEWISLSPQVKYRKKAGIVTIVGDSSGDVSLPVHDSATTIGTLPEEFRPSIDVHAVGTPKSSSGYMLQIRVFPTGQVSLVNLNPNYNLSFWGFSLSYPV